MKKVTYRDILELTPKEQDYFWNRATRIMNRCGARKRRALAQNKLELGVHDEDRENQRVG